MYTQIRTCILALGGSEKKKNANICRLLILRLTPEVFKLQYNLFMCSLKSAFVQREKKEKIRHLSMTFDSFTNTFDLC